MVSTTSSHQDIHLQNTLLVADGTQECDGCNFRVYLLCKSFPCIRICVDCLYAHTYLINFLINNTLTILEYEFWTKKSYRFSPNGPDIYFLFCRYAVNQDTQWVPDKNISSQDVKIAHPLLSVFLRRKKALSFLLLRKVAMHMSSFLCGLHYSSILAFSKQMGRWSTMKLNSKLHRKSIPDLETWMSLPVCLI